MPRFSDDDVIDFQVAEAVTLRRLQSDASVVEQQRQKQRVEEWRKQKPGSGPPQEA